MYERCHLVQGGQASEDLFCGYTGCAVRPKADCETAAEAEAGPGTIGACHPVLVRHRKKEARLPAPPHRWVVVERRRPRSTQACMASCVREGRDRAHLCCAAIPSVIPGSYRRGRLLLWVFGVVDLPAVLPVYLLKFYLFSTWVGFAMVSSFLDSSGSLLPSLLFVALLLVSAGAIGTPCGCRGSAPVLEVFVVVDHAELSFSFLAFLTPIWWTSHRACILAIFAAFPSCGVPAWWRDLRNVVLGICSK